MFDESKGSTCILGRRFRLWSCENLSRHRHDTARHRYHLDGDAELHTGGLTCCRPPAASSAAFRVFGSLHRLRYVQIFAVLQTMPCGRRFVDEGLSLAFG